MKHKHADLIHAWADGAEIQKFNPVSKEWMDCKGTPQWDELYGYRIKPEEKKPVVRWLWAVKGQSIRIATSVFYTEEEAEQFEDNPIKLEWSRTEFTE